MDQIYTAVQVSNEGAANAAVHALSRRVDFGSNFKKFSSGWVLNAVAAPVPVRYAGGIVMSPDPFLRAPVYCRQLTASSIPEGPLIGVRPSGHSTTKGFECTTDVLDFNEWHKLHISPSVLSAAI